MKGLKMNIQFFADEEAKKEEETKQEETGVEENYIETIKKLKDTTVDKDKYDELAKQNKELLDAIIDGKEIDYEKVHESAEDTMETIKTLRKELYGSKFNDMSNYDYISKTLKLRKALMDSGEDDPFLPHGQNIQPTEDDRKKAAHVAEVYQECLDYADEAIEDKEGVFTNELMRRTVDAAPMRNRKR